MPVCLFRAYTLSTTVFLFCLAEFGDSITDNVLQDDLQHTVGLLIEQTGDIYFIYLFLFYILY